MCVYGDRKLSTESRRILSIGFTLTTVSKMGDVRPAFAPGPALGLGDSSCVAQHPTPHTDMHCPSLLTSVLYHAGLQVPLLPQRQDFLGLWVRAGYAELRVSLRLGPGCVLVGVCAAGLPCFLFMSSWADPRSAATLVDSVPPRTSSGRVGKQRN